jgi:uncharacterized protein YbaR (Trm112 family)
VLEMQWVACPICNSKTRIKIRRDTIMENFPLFCPKCKQEKPVAFLAIGYWLFIERGYPAS